MKTYLQHDPATGTIIDLVEKREYNDANEQLHKVRIRCSEWAEVAGKHGAEIDILRRANAELIARLAEARESHLHASARDIKTIQRQSVELASADREIERLNLMVKMMDESCKLTGRMEAGFQTSEPD